MSASRGRTDSDRRSVKMSRLEKGFVNRRKKAERNVEKVAQRLSELDAQDIRDVLELGCGIGAVSAYLSTTHGMNVVGTDFDPEQIELARGLYPENDRLRFRVQDASRLDFEDATFDLVVAQNVLHHVPDWKRAVEEVVRVLRPGGYFLWLDLASPRWLKNLLRAFVKHHGLYTIGEIRDAFQKGGLHSRFDERIPHGPFSHYHMVLQKADMGSRPVDFVPATKSTL